VEVPGRISIAPAAGETPDGYTETVAGASVVEGVAPAIVPSA